MCQDRCVRKAEKALNTIDQLHDAKKITQKQHDHMSHEVLEKLSAHKRLRGTIFTGEM